MTRRAVIYIRVSDQSQIENNSLESQLKTCDAFAKQSGYEVIKIYREEGKSAKEVFTREKLKELMSFCLVKANHIDAMIVYKYDRFSRNSADGQAAIALLAKAGVDVISATEGAEDNPSGRAMRTILLALAQLDNEIKGERVHDNMQAVFRKGFWPFKCPVGYKRFSRNKEENMGIPPLVDKHLGPIVTEMFKNAASGIYSKEQLARMMNSQGFGDHYRAKSTHKIVDSILRKTFYYGEMYGPKWKERVWGKHEPLTDKETWELAYNRVILKKKNYVYQDEAKYPLKGHLRCSECGAPLTTSPSTGRSKKYYYYECRSKSCKKIRTLADDAHKQFELILEQIKPSPRVLRLFDSTVFSTWDKEIARSEASLEKADQHLLTLKNDITNIRKSVDNGLLTMEEGKEQIEIVRQNIAVAEIEKADIKCSHYDKEVVRNFTRSFLENIDGLWRDMNLSKKQAFLALIFPNGILCDNNRKIRTDQLSPSFELIVALSEQKGENVTPQGIEPWLAE